MNTTDALVYSQVVLSFALPIPMIALILFTRNRDVMGEFANSRVTDVLAIFASVIVLCLNVVLLWQALEAPIPGLPPA